MTRLLVGAMLAALLLSGCAGDGAPPDGPIDAHRIEGCIVQEETSRTLRTWAEVDTFFVDFCTDEPPELDLADQVIVVHATGERPTGGYEVRLRSADLRGDAAMVVFTRHEPDAACGAAEATYPTAVYVLDARPDSISIEYVVQVDPCG